MNFENALSIMRTKKTGYIFSESADEYRYHFCMMSLRGYDEKKWESLGKSDKNGNMDTSRHGWGIPLNLIILNDWQYCDNNPIPSNEKELQINVEEQVRDGLRAFFLSLFINIYGPFRQIPDYNKMTDFIIETFKTEFNIK